MDIPKPGSPKSEDHKPGSPKPEDHKPGSLKPKDHRTHDFFRPQGGERTSTPAKDTESSEGDWQARRKQFVDEKMEKHEANSREIDTLKATATEHEKTISKHVQTAEGLIKKLSDPGMQYQAQRDLRIYNHIEPIEYERILQAFADIDDKEKSKEVYKYINDLYNSLDNLCEEPNETEKSLKKDIDRILRQDIRKMDTIKGYIQIQESTIEDLANLINGIKGNIEKSKLSFEYKRLSEQFVQYLENYVNDNRNSAFVEEISEIAAILHRTKVRRDLDSISALDATRDLREIANQYRDVDQMAESIAKMFERLDQMWNQSKEPASSGQADVPPKMDSNPLSLKRQLPDSSSQKPRKKRRTNKANELRSEGASEVTSTTPTRSSKREVAKAAREEIKRQVEDPWGENTREDQAD